MWLSVVVGVMWVPGGSTKMLLAGRETCEIEFTALENGGFGENGTRNGPRTAENGPHRSGGCCPERAVPGPKVVGREGYGVLSRPWVDFDEV